MSEVAERLAAAELPRDLGDGLVMRRATVADREPLASLHAHTLIDVGETAPADRVYYWVLDLMSGEHPSIRASDFILVEDTAAGKMVSSVALFSQTWTYDGIPFKVGQPETVSTDPAYRRRGLVRAQFEEIHRWSAARGEVVQGITGIPWYYRQFGYEMALNLGGGRVAYKPNVPRLADGAAEPYRFRRATPDDVPFIREMYQRATARSLIAAERDAALWRFEVDGRQAKSGIRRVLRVIEPVAPGEPPAGLLIHGQKSWGGRLGVGLYELQARVPFLAVTPSVLRYLERTGEEYAERDGEAFTAFSFNLGERHPVYETIPDRLPRVGPPYAWYLRVPDLPAFVTRIAPALERRLAASPQAGYTGELKLSFYRDGLQVTFQTGRITVAGWTPDRIEAGDAAFPDLTFLQILFGYRSLDELRHAFADCWADTDEARALLPILFPKQASNVWSGG
ncbi:MAG: GNAT family N-acetyltransferase [Chloroflexia bacterium]|nr:GNAT family N-acetyltransferase [Chloroflexia bacterium]